jgi:hypothetical protein
LHEIITLVLVYLLDDVSGRRYLRPVTDLQLLLAPLTEPLVETVKSSPGTPLVKPAAGTESSADGRVLTTDTSPIAPPKWIEACRVVMSLLRWWSGLITLCAHPHGLKSLLLALHYNPAHHPSLTSLHVVLDVLYEVLRIPSPSSSSSGGPSFLYSSGSSGGGASMNPSSSSSSLTSEVKKSSSFEQLATSTSSTDLRSLLMQLHGENVDPLLSGTNTSATQQQLYLQMQSRMYRHNLVWNHVATLLRVLIDQGLVDALIELANEMLRRDDSNVTMSPFRLIYAKVTVLLGEVLFISNRLLSPAQCARLQQLPALVERAVMFRTGSRPRSLFPVTMSSFLTSTTSRNNNNNNNNNADTGRRSSSVTTWPVTEPEEDTTEASSEERERVRERERASSTITLLHKYTSIKQSLHLLHGSSTPLPSTSPTSGTTLSSTLPSARRTSVSDTVSPLRAAAVTTTTTTTAPISPAATATDYLSLNRRLDRMSEVKRKMDWLMDEETLFIKLKETGVLQYSAREYTHWHLEEALELLEGPLRNPSLLNIALKTKFFARLLSFYKPQKGLFSKLKESPETTIYVRVACQLFEALIDNDVGKAYLQEHPFLKHVGEMFASEIQRNQNATADSESPLSRDVLLKTLTREYFTLLGILSRSERGQELLRHHRLYNYFVKLCEIDGRDDLIRLILTSLDYNKTIPSELEILSASQTSTQQSKTSSMKDKQEQTPTLSILCSVLASKSLVVRYLAVRHLRSMLRPDQTWPVDCLVSKLHDSDSKIRTLALSLLDEAIDHRTCLEHFIDLISIPSTPPKTSSTMSFMTRMESSLSGTIELQALMALGSMGVALLIRCLSCQKGLTKLLQANFVKPQMEQWLTVDNEQYVLVLDRKLQHVFTRSLSRSSYRDSTRFDLLFISHSLIIHPHTLSLSHSLSHSLPLNCFCVLVLLKVKCLFRLICMASWPKQKRAVNLSVSLDTLCNL